MIKKIKPSIHSREMQTLLDFVPDMVYNGIAERRISSSKMKEA